MKREVVGSRGTDRGMLQQNLIVTMSKSRESASVALPASCDWLFSMRLDWLNLGIFLCVFVGV